VRDRIKDPSIAQAQRYNTFDAAISKEAEKYYKFAKPGAYEPAKSKARLAYDQANPDAVNKSQAQVNYDIAAKKFNEASARVLKTTREGYRSYEGDNNQADFIKRSLREKAIADQAGLAKIKATKAVVDLGKHQLDIAKQTERLKSVGTDAANLGVGFSANDMSKFTGLDKDLAQYKLYADQHLEAQKAFQDSSTLSARKFAQERLASTEANAKALIDINTNDLLLGTQTQQQSGALGGTVSVDALTAFKISGDKASKAFSEASSEYLRLKAELDNAPSDATPAYLQDLRNKANDARLSLQKMSPKDFSLEGINSALQKFDVPTINMAEYINLPTADIVDLTAKIKAVNDASVDAANALGKVGQDGSGLDAYQAKLRGLTSDIYDLKIASANALSRSIRTITDNGISGAAGASLAGITDPNILSSNTRSTKALKLQKTISDANVNAYSQQKYINDNQGKVDPKYIKMASDSLTENANKAAQAQVALSALGTKNGGESRHKDRYGFKELLADINEAGIEINALSFARLSQDARSNVSSVAAEIHKIEEALKKAAPTQDVSSLLTKKAELLGKIREKLVVSFSNTGKGFFDSLSRSGLTDAATIARIDTQQLQQLVELDKKIQLKKLKADDTSNLQEAIQLQAEALKLERERDVMLQKLTVTADKYAERINEAFSTSLDAVNTGVFGVQFSAYLANAADAVKAKLQAFADAGVSSFAFARKLKQTGEYISLFSDISNSFADAWERGAKTGLAKIKEIFPNFDLNERQFNKLPQDQRKKITSDAVNTDFFRKALELPNLTPGLGKIINDAVLKPGADLEALRKSFEELFKTEFGQDLKDFLATPLDKNTKATEDNTKALLGKLNTTETTTLTTKDVAAAIKTEWPTAIIKDPAKHKKLTADGNVSDHYGPDPHALDFSVPGVRLTTKAVEAALAKYGIKPRYNVGGTKQVFGPDMGPHGVNDKSHKNHIHFGFADTRQTSTADPQITTVDAPKPVDYVNKPRDLFRPSDELLAALDHKLATGRADLIPEATRIAASPKQQVKLNKAADDIRAKMEEIDTAVANGLPTDKLAKQLKDMREDLDKFSNSILNADSIFKKLGDTIATSLDSNLKTALYDAFTGKGDFFKTIFDGLSSDILHTIVNSMTDSITGENGFITKAIKGVFDGSLFGGQKQDTSGVGSLFDTASAFGASGKTPWTFGQGLDPNGSGAMSLIPNIGSNLTSDFGAIGNSLNSLPDMSGSIAPISNGIGGLLGKGGAALGGDITGSLTDGADVLGSTFGSSTDALTKGLGDTFKTSTDTLTKGIGKSLGGAGGGMSGLAGAAGGLGALFGTLIGSFFADGGHVSGPGTGTSDSIPAMLSDGEFVVNAKATKKHGNLLKAINSGTITKLAKGGPANGNSLGTPILALPTMSTIDQSKLTSKADGGKTEINLGITGDISRQTRSEIYNLLPQIAAGVNAHNKEKGYK